MERYNFFALNTIFISHLKAMLVEGSFVLFTPCFYNKDLHIDFTLKLMILEITCNANFTENSKIFKV